MTDIVSNHRRSFKEVNQRLLPSLKGSIARGVWETRTELASVAEQKNMIKSESAFKSLAKSKIYSKEIYFQNPTLNLYEETETAWWDIDLETGSTIGMMKLSQGIGGAVSTEYIIKKINIASFFDIPRICFIWDCDM